MEKSSTVDRLTKIIIITLNEIQGEEGDIESIGPDEDLVATYGVSSVHLVSLIIKIEKSFDITISDIDLDIENFSSVETLSEMLEDKYRVST